MQKKVKYGIFTLNILRLHKHAEKFKAIENGLTPEQRLLGNEPMIRCEELPEMEFDSLSAAVEAMADRYGNKLEPVENEHGIETLTCYVLDSEHNLVAGMSKDTTVIFAKE